MVAMEEKLREVIERAFPNSRVEIMAPKMENKGIGEFFTGKIVWEGFKSMDYRERQRLFDEKVWNALGKEGRRLNNFLLLATGEKD